MLLRKDKQKVNFSKGTLPAESDHSESPNACLSNTTFTSHTHVNVPKRPNHMNINKRNSLNNPAYGWDYGNNVRSLGTRSRGFTRQIHGRVLRGYVRNDPTPIRFNPVRKMSEFAQLKQSNRKAYARR